MNAVFKPASGTGAETKSKAKSSSAASSAAAAGSGSVSAEEAFLHGASLVVLDGLGIGTADSENVSAALRAKCLEYLSQQLSEATRERVLAAMDNTSIESSVRVSWTPLLEARTHWLVCW